MINSTLNNEALIIINYKAAKADKAAKENKNADSVLKTEKELK